MRSLGKWLGRIVIVIGAVLAVVIFAPGEGIERVEAPRQINDAVGYLAARENDDEITEGTEARIIWAGEEGARSDTVVLYLHGFSASSEEIRPVPDRVAEAFGANLVFSRLTGHGSTGEALGAARAGDWVEDAEMFLEIARQVGDRVIVIGTSTGATLAAYILAEQAPSEAVEAVVMISPNFEVANPAGPLLELFGARVWVPWIAGAERSFEPINAGQATYWTTRYPTVATVSMGTLLRETRARDYSGVDIPALFLFSDTDQVISAPAAREFAARWGGETTVIPVAVPDEGGDPFHHVIAGDILSPALTDRAVDDIVGWLRETLD
ncbi:alpha/beta hydrolase [Gymnodinialimonas ulvae]|uniref:alpha/beta hydrolase n=1 Tax=Gymnodinialimonas ulvae TaxID=3126504 RepID=UPI0030966851